MSTPWWPLVEPTPRWVTVRLGEQVVAASRRALLYVQYGPGLLPGVGLPTYYLPAQDVREGALVEESTDAAGTVSWTVQAGGERAERAAWSHRQLEPVVAALRDHVSFSWQALRWFEEDEEVHVHARDPHKRVDVLASSRSVQVSVAGQVIADSSRPLVLFETGLPTRYYLPPRDVRLDLLEPTATSTVCPYKGTARYWSVRTDGAVLPDVAWSYPTSQTQPRIAGLISFWDERVDVVVDGERQERPRTLFS